MSKKPRLAVVGDLAYSTTGFASVMRGLITCLEDRYDIAQFAINYNGDWFPEQSKFRFYPAADVSRQDIYGFTKLTGFLKRENPDVVFVLQDSFIADKYAVKIREVLGDNVPSVLYCPVDSTPLDAKNVNLLNLYDCVVAYTEFGKSELVKRGLKRDCRVIPHGLFTDEIYPVSKLDARRVLGLDDRERFIVLNVSMNQPRKRVDLFLYVMSEWLKRYPNDDVYFYYHGPIVRQGGIHVPQVIRYLAESHTELDFSSRFITTSDNPLETISRDYMKYLYSSADVYLAVSAQEGWNLPLMEAMRCNVASVAPRHSATAEWTSSNNGDGVVYINVDEKPNFYTSQNNFAFQDINIDSAVNALETLYRSEYVRDAVAKRGYDLVSQPMFSWPVVADQFDAIFTELLAAKAEANTELQSEEN